MGNKFFSSTLVMDVESLLQEPPSPRKRPTAGRRRLSTGTVTRKPPRISRRLGHLLRARTGSKSEDVSVPAEEQNLFGDSDNNQSPESHSPVVTRRIRSSSISLDSGRQLYPIQFPDPLEPDEKSEHDEGEIAPYAALNKVYQDLENLWQKQIQHALLNDEETLRSICTHAQEDPMISRDKRVWKKKESVGKIDPITKKIEKSIVEEDRKIGAREYHTKTLISGCPEGQWIFRHRVAEEAERGIAEMKARFRLSYFQVAAEMTARAIQVLQKIEMFSQLPVDVQKQAEQLLAGTRGSQENVRADQLSKEVSALYQNQMIQQTIEQECFFHPHRAYFKYIFSNLAFLAGSEFAPSFLDFQRLHTLWPTETSVVWAKIGSLRYKLIWTDVFSGKAEQWIRLFDDSEILMFWLNLSDVASVHQSISELKLVASATKSKDCAFLYLLDGDKLEQIAETEDMTQHFRGYKPDKGIVEYLERFCKKELTKVQKPTFKVYCDRVDSTRPFDFKSFLSRSYNHMKDEEKQMALSESLHGITVL